MANFLTRKHLSRRRLLRGGGVALALPFLDAMVPASTAQAQVAAMPKKRAGFFYLPHGTIMNNTPFGKDVDQWTSSGKGADFRMGKMLESLEPLKKYVTTFDNIENTAAFGSVHTKNPATWLSCVVPGDGSIPQLTTTLDQVIAQQLGQETALPSLELATETTIQVAAGNGGFYAVTTSFASPNQPLPMEFNPRKVFIQLMGPYDTQEERARILSKNRSMLDMIADRTRSLQKELGSGDQAILSDYLDTVREIERRVQIASDQDMSGIDVPKAPVGVFENFDEQITIMYDLIALAYQADLTRIATLVTAAEGTDRTYPQVGVNGGFHPVSHHTNDIARIQDLIRIQTYHMQHFARFVQKLADTPDGDGSILDHSLFLYGSNMGNSNQHDNYPLPEILVGGASGAHKGGKHVSPPPRTPLANIHLTILDKLGIGQESFGNGTGILTDV
jgi:hypothetical protein